MEERYAVVLPVKSEPILVHCDDGESMALKSLQEMVDGYIECVNNLIFDTELSEDVEPVLVVNEEGRLKGFKINRAATIMAVDGFGIVGNAVLMAARGDELVGFLEKDAKKIKEDWEEWCQY